LAVAVAVIVMLAELHLLKVLAEEQVAYTQVKALQQVVLGDH
jgi:hypothetical protein